MATATILGAGPAGLATAVTLARRGWQVTVYEAAPDFRSACGWLAGGMLAPACERESAEPIVERLGRRSLALWPELGVTVRGGGTLVLAHPRDRTELQRFDRLTPPHERLERAGIEALEPELDARFRAGLYYPEEAHLDPWDALPALAASARAAGAAVHFASRAAPRRDPGADWTIDCRGLAAADSLGDLRAVKGELAVLSSPELCLHRVVRLLHPRQSLYVVPRSGGRFVVGATSLESDAEGVTVRSALDLLSAAYSLHSGFGEAAIEGLHSGRRPAFPDNRPRVIPEPGTRRLWINGLYRHGWLLAPAVAEAAADYLETGSSDTELVDADYRQWRIPAGQRADPGGGA